MKSGHSATLSRKQQAASSTASASWLLIIRNVDRSQENFQLIKHCKPPRPRYPDSDSPPWELHRNVPIQCILLCVHALANVCFFLIAVVRSLCIYCIHLTKGIHPIVGEHSTVSMLGCYKSS